MPSRLDVNIQHYVVSNSVGIVVFIVFVLSFVVVVLVFPVFVLFCLFVAITLIQQCYVVM